MCTHAHTHNTGAHAGARARARAPTCPRPRDGGESLHAHPPLIIDAAPTRRAVDVGGPKRGLVRARKDATPPWTASSCVEWGGGGRSGQSAGGLRGPHCLGRTAPVLATACMPRASAHRALHCLQRAPRCALTAATAHCTAARCTSLTPTYLRSKGSKPRPGERTCLVSPRSAPHARIAADKGSTPQSPWGRGTCAGPHQQASDNIIASGLRPVRTSAMRDDLPAQTKLCCDDGARVFVDTVTVV